MDNNRQQSDNIAELVCKGEAERRVNTRRKFITLLLSGCGYACWWWHRNKTNRRSVKVDAKSFLEARNPLMARLKHSGPIIGPNGQSYSKEATIALPGGAKMEMIYCPPGEFMMGSEVDDNLADSDEKTANGKHKVRITHGFWLGKYEVTQGQWENVMGNNPSYFKSPTRPVEKVSWFDCQEFISKIANEVRRQLGGYACLPTEAEWEYACRAGTNKSLPSSPDGKEIRIIGQYHGEGLDEVAWYGGNSCVGFELPNGCSDLSKEVKEYEGAQAGTHPVGEKKPNNWGFYDMIGNVWEWCNDWYASEYYSNNAMCDPKGPIAGDGGLLGERRVSRGGSWYSDAQMCRSANRGCYDPFISSPIRGFRLCCSTEPRE